MPQDRRVRKSQAAIRHAFIDLLHKYELEQITVQQISDLADVNRSTFYTHYIDKYDLLEKLEDEQVEIIRTFIEEEMYIRIKHSLQKVSVRLWNFNR